MIFADCLRLSKSTIITNYNPLIPLVERFRQWIRIARYPDDHEKERLQRHFVLLLTECSANYIHGNLQEANEEMGIECCAATLLENGKLFASRGVEDSELDHIICSALLSVKTCSFLSRLLDHLVNNIKGQPEEVEDTGDTGVLDAFSTLKISLEQREVEDIDVLDDVSTLTISLKQLRTLKKLKCFSPTTHQTIEEHVSKIHLEKICSKQDTSFKKSRDLVEKAKEARKEGFDGLAKCIEHLDAAISEMGDLLSKNTNERGPAYHVLAQAYCLRAFCYGEKEPNSKVFLEDIAQAQWLWFMEEHMDFVEQNPLVSNYTFKLLQRVCGLLLNKDAMEGHHSGLYELMIKCLCGSYSLEDCMIKLWQSKSLSHSYCTSPINDVFLEAFSKQSASYDSLTYWRDCFTMLKPADVGFWNNMSIVPSQDYNDDEAIEQARLYADEILKGDMSAKSTYLVANIYYDLAERMIAKGFLTEAVPYANTANILRARLWSTCFVDQSISKRSILLDPLVATKAWSYDHEDFLNPYVILRCHLESLFQEGSIMEILGEGDKSMKYFAIGKNISDLLGLPNFMARFSVALAKVFRKKQVWQEDGLELKNLNNTLKEIACDKCKSSLQAILQQESVDLVRQKKNKAADNFEEATTDDANKLWESCADRVEVDCATKCGCKVRFGSDKAYCWHCKPVEDNKPTSLKTLIRKKWLWTQRRYRLKVLIGLGKYFMIKGETEKAHKLFLECICLVISMSTVFQISSCSISLRSLFEYIEKNSVQDVNRENCIEDVLRIELASLAYAISWFSLKSYTRFESYNIPVTMLVSVLKYSFIVSREVPELFQKISRLLSIMYTLPCTSKDLLLMSSSTDAPSQSEWASFFHQASLGTNLNHTYQLQMLKMKMVPNQSSSSSSSFLRVAPESVTDLERFVREFYQGLGPGTIVGISLLENGYCGLLRSFLPDGPSSTLAWLMFSRFSLSCKPVVLLKRIHSIAGPSVDTSLNDGPPWKSPWENTIVDKVAPITRLIARPDQDIRRITQDENDKKNQWVKDLVEAMEEKWFGKWNFLLSGRSLNLSGCYIEGQDPIPLTSNRIGSSRIPLVLVLDMDIQMLPWESMAITKCEDIYRMPSMSSILYAYAKCSKTPIIDPCNTYYRIGFDQDDSSYAKGLELFLKVGCGLKGKKSKDPNNLKELFQVLLSTDLFFYYGHKDGSNCIFGDQLKDLPRCSASILMACRSGVLELNGSYMPRGPPLNYLLAGSPFVLANLWNTRDHEGTIYCKFLFDALVRSWRCDKNIGEIIGEIRNYFRNGYYFMSATVCYGVPTMVRKKNP